MYFPDLATECQIATGPRVRAVGWLSAAHAFTRGDVDVAVVQALGRLVEEGWVHVAAAGPHECELCRSARESRNVLVPGADVLYVAPAMVTHYIRDHGYGPPAAFVDSVRACPDPTTDAYYAELRRFADVFSLTPERFDRFTRQHRDGRAEREADAGRKPLTWG